MSNVRALRGGCSNGSNRVGSCRVVSISCGSGRRRRSASSAARSAGLRSLFVAILAPKATTVQIAALSAIEFMPFVLLTLPAGGDHQWSSPQPVDPNAWGRAARGAKRQRGGTHNSVRDAAERSITRPIGSSGLHRRCRRA